ncbi:MAG: universal stress protein, partial [Bacteroidetes bacterium]|nr:universal stress protein [Bacteroidota bacterium]
MKTVLIATDYSAAAKNASRYGIQLARILKAKVILLHAYQIPILVTEVPVIADFDEFEKESLRNILAEKKILDPQMELDIECISSFGFVVDD